MYRLLFFCAILFLFSCQSKTVSDRNALAKVEDGGLYNFIAEASFRSTYGITTDLTINCLNPTRNAFMDAQECEYKWEDEAKDQFMGLQIGHRIFKDTSTFKDQLNRLQRLMENEEVSKQWENLDFGDDLQVFLYKPDLHYTIMFSDSITFSLKHSRRLLTSDSETARLRVATEKMLRKAF